MKGEAKRAINTSSTSALRDVLNTHSAREREKKKLEKESDPCIAVSCENTLLIPVVLNNIDRMASSFSGFFPAVPTEPGLLEEELLDEPMADFRGLFGLRACLRESDFFVSFVFFVCLTACSVALLSLCSLSFESLDRGLGRADFPVLSS